MFIKLNYIFNLIMKSLSETANISIPGILFIYLFLDIDSHILINKIVVFSLINFLSAYALDSFIFRGESLNNRKKYTYFFIAIILSVISAFITSRDTRLVPFILYLIIWYKSIVSITDKGDFQSTKKIFVISLLLYLFVIFILSLTNGESDTAIKLKSFFPIYVGASLSYFATINLERVYNKKNTNSLNKSKNIRIVNLISNSVILVFLVSTLTGFFGIWKKVFSSNIVKGLGGILQKVAEVVLYPIVFLTSRLAELIFRKADLLRLKRLNIGKTPEEIEETVNETISTRPQIIIDIIFTIAKWGTIFLIIYIILFYIIKAINNKVLYKNIEDEEEEKEFILSSKDVPGRMKKSFKKLFSDIAELFSKSNENFLNLHIIRRIYIDTILILKDEGYKFKNHQTPNEYLFSLEQSKYVDTGIGELTKVYNDYRYGGKEPTKEELEECARVKKNIYEISKEK